MVSLINVFEGDTALHLAIKQKKMKSIYSLLLMDADTTIRNAKGENAEDLSLRLLNKSIRTLKNESIVSVCLCL